MLYTYYMTDIDDGYYFWKRVDIVRPKQVTLKQIVEEAGLSYHLVKVQRSCNRIPKALEAARLATVLEVSLEWLLTGKIGEISYTENVLSHRERRQISRIFHKLMVSDYQKLQSVESARGISASPEKSRN